MRSTTASAGRGETLRHMAEIAAGGRVLGYAGLGASFEEAASPARFTVKGVPFAFSSMGIAGGGVPAEQLGDGLAGQLNIHNDHAPVVARLAGTDARFRILSMHFGQERQAQPGSDQLQRWRDEISRGAGIDIIVGHHSHIPQGIEIINSRLIFYGMGNFLHQGMSDMGGNNNCRDWGVMAKVHLVAPPAGRLQIAAVEIVPVTDMHIQARPLRAEEGRRRIMAMNGLSRALGSERTGGEPLRLLPQEDGSGLYCAAGSDSLPEPLRSLCAGHRAAERTEGGRIVVDVPVSACGDGGYERVASTEREPRRGRGRAAASRAYADESVAERPRRVRSRAATRISARQAARRKGKAAKVQVSAVRSSTR